MKTGCIQKIIARKWAVKRWAWDALLVLIRCIHKII